MHCMIACSPTRARIHYKTAENATQIQQWLTDAGHTCNLYLKPFAYVVEARTNLVMQFLESDADALVGLDNDLTISKEVLDTMLNAGVSYVGARIPDRVTSLARFAEGVRKGMDNEEAARFAAGSDGGKGEIRKVDKVYGGFFVMRKEPLQKLIETGAAPRKILDIPQGPQEMYAFYDPLFDENGIQLSADDSFSKRLREAGFDIHEYIGPGITQTAEIMFSS